MTQATPQRTYSVEFMLLNARHALEHLKRSPSIECKPYMDAMDMLEDAADELEGMLHAEKEKK